MDQETEGGETERGTQSAAPGTQTFCRACGNLIDPRAVICPKCGVPAKGDTPLLGEAAKIVINNTAQAGGGPSHPGVIGGKSPGLAAFLSFLLPGLGQGYTGYCGRGVAVFLIGAFVAVPLSIVSFGIVGFAYWIWNIIDAYNCATKTNALASGSGKQTVSNIVS